jgi:hypothetical protein
MEKLIRRPEVSSDSEKNKKYIIYCNEISRKICDDPERLYSGIFYPSAQAPGRRNIEVIWCDTSRTTHMPWIAGVEFDTRNSIDASSVKKLMSIFRT